MRAACLLLPDLASMESYSPITGVLMPKEGKAKVLNEAEFKRLLMAARSGQFALRNVALLYCSFGLGLRAKEMATLTIADVTDTHYRLLDEICLTRAMTKGEKQRHAYLTHKKVCDALQEYIASLQCPDRKKPLFQTQRRARFTPNALQKWFKYLYDKAGITGASSHSGRRTFITRLIEQGGDIKAVSRLAGHASIVTTAIYVADNPERLKRLTHMAVF